jgi:hypothetical protein
MSAALTTQVLAILPIQAALVAGFALAKKKGEPGNFLEILTIALLGSAVICTAYALMKVHARVLWEQKNEIELREFAAKEARAVAAKAFWSRAGMAVTMLAALAVVGCNLIVFTS